MRIACVAGLAAALFACGGGSVVEAPPPSAVTAVIGAQGGTVDGPDGVQVIIPPGALAQPTTIGIARSSAGAPALPTDNAPVGAVYEFTPHDVVFNAPVTVRMPIPSGAVGNELLMASPGGDWEVVEASVTAGVAQWQRNSFSWSLMGAVCGIPADNTDPYPCVRPSGYATASATPAAAITRSDYDHFVFGGSGNAGSWVVKQAGAVRVTLNYKAAPDCGINGAPLTGQVKLIRWNPAASPVVVQTVFDATVSLTATPQTAPIGTLASGTGGPVLRGVGSTTVDVSAYLTDAVNAFGFSFACARPGKALARGGDLLTFSGALPSLPGPFTVGGTVSGLNSAGLVLQNDGGDDLAVAAGATSFTFPTSTAAGTSYSVSVLSQPAGETCSVQHGTGTGTATADVTNVAIACFGPGTTPLLARAVVAGVNNSLVVATDGTVWAWGYQVDPVTGAHKPSAPFATLPVQVQGLSGVKAVALSGESGAFYALHNDGTVSAWGYNTAGQLGDRTTTDRALPVKVLQDATTPMDEVCSIAAAANILLMARETGCSPGQRAVAPGPWIVGWFANTSIGGDSSPSGSNGAIAKAVPGWPAGQTVSQLRTPDSASTAPAAFFLTGRGDRYVWGFNGSNLLGAGTSVQFAGGAAGPVAPNGLFWSGLSAPELGRDFAVAFDETGSLLAVGRNLEGQLGNGGTASSSSFVAVSAPTGVTSVSVGQNSVAAIANGELWAWGWDANRVVAVPLPKRVGSLSGFTQVSVGDAHSLAIGPGGQVYSWGSSFAGALGRTGTAGTPAPVFKP